MSAIGQNDRRIQYTTAGGEPSFAYDFQIDDADHVEVYRDGVLQTRGTHYRVTGVGNSGGGDIEVDASITVAAGEVWTIEGDTPEDRSNDYSGFARVPPATVDADLDRMIFMMQQIRRDSDRSVRFNPGSTATDATLPLPSTGKTIKWKADGTFENSSKDPDQAQTDAQASADAAAVSETNAATSESNAATSEANAAASATAAETAAEKAPRNKKTGTSYTGVLSDAGKIVERDNASANDFTVPPNSSVPYPVDTWINVFQYGAGQTTIVAGAGVTIRTPETLKIRKRYGIATLVKRGTNEWHLFGDLELA